MSKTTETIIRNIVYILILELVLFPFGVFIWMWHGWHIFHIALGMGYLFGISLIIETANLLLKHVRIVNDKEAETSQNETFYE